MARMFSQSSRFTGSTLFDLSRLDDKIQTHLADVYRKLLIGMLVASSGVAASIAVAVHAPYITAIFSIIALMWMLNTPKHQHQQRLALYSAFCFFKGYSIGGLVDLALEIDPSALLIAFGATCLVFGAFSVVAMTARRREYLYLGGMLSSATVVLFLLGFANIFIGSEALLDVNVWFGLAIFVAWVVVDTQVIIEKASRETEPDALAHAAELFIDMVSIFVRILIIILRSSKKNRDD